jgi:hypothetical protein
MPSIPSSSVGPDALLSLALSAHEQLADDPRGALLRVHASTPVAGGLRWWSLDHVHPVEALLGFVAPRDWRAIGVCSTGRAHSPRGTEAVTVTLLVDRAGATASVLQRGRALEVLPGRPDGVVADACRRALGLPTAPPPGSSVVLWTLTWLERVVAEAHARVPGQAAPSWAAVARLHPANSGPSDPVGLALDAAALAEAWPWSRLRVEPALADLPGSPPSPAVAHWMDDGMWARWLIRDLPPAADMLDAVRALLTPVLADAIHLVVAAAVESAGSALDEWDQWSCILDEDRR